MSKPEINVTPLIDVLLVLLIIFMVITPTKPSKLEAKIPSKPKNDGAEPPPLMLVVEIDGSRNIALNRTDMGSGIESTGNLTDKLRDVFKAREENLENEKTVFIKAPQKLDYGSVAKLIDAVKMSGAKPISLQVDDLK
jgi:biopolymer transport protein TolR